MNVRIKYIKKRTQRSRKKIRKKMPKRKRAEDEGFDKSFERFNKELFRALKVAKGFERQRLAKRVKDVKLPQDKIQRLEQEVEVLKVIF